jgi:hypothetical protein
MKACRDLATLMGRVGGAQRYVKLLYVPPAVRKVTLRTRTPAPHPYRGLYSETGFHIGMDRNFVVYGVDTIAEVTLLISPFLR